MDKVKTLAEFLDEPGPTEIFQSVVPFSVQVDGAPWSGGRAVVALVAYTNEPPDGVLWAWADPDDLEGEGWCLINFSMGFGDPLTDPVWGYVRPGLTGWPDEWLKANVGVVIAAARRIALSRQRER